MHAPGYDGILQGVGNGTVLGWAADRAAPDVRVPVSLVVDGEVVAEAVADTPRPDLAEMDLGDGAHGFLIALPERLQQPARRRIVALVGPELVAIRAAPSFWQKASADSQWSDVVFEPGGALSAPVPGTPEHAPTAALVDDGGWLYDMREEEHAEMQPSASELERLVAMLVANAQRCGELGIGYIPALVPRKRDVVAGLLAGTAASDRGEQTCGRPPLASALMRRLRDVDGVELVDLLSVLCDACVHGAPYHRTDAGWNDRGAFFVARALLKEAHKHAPALHPPTLADLHVREVPGYRGDLADVAKLERVSAAELAASSTAVGTAAPSALQLAAEIGVTIDPAPLQALRMPVESHLADAAPIHLRVYAAPTQDEDARLAVVGDAAALSLVPWLAERTSRTTFFWASELPLVQLELELPRVVVQLLREADLQLTLGQR
jgi:hypothetical protein